MWAPNWSNGQFPRMSVKLGSAPFPSKYWAKSMHYGSEISATFIINRVLPCLSFTLMSAPWAISKSIIATAIFLLSSYCSLITFSYSWLNHCLSFFKFVFKAWGAKRSKGQFPWTSFIFGSAPFSSKNLVNSTQLGSVRSIMFIIKSVFPWSSLPFTSTLGSFNRRMTVPLWLLSIAIAIGVTFQLFKAWTSAPCWIKRSMHSIKPEAAA